MTYIDRQLDKIQQHLLERGCGLCQEDMAEIGNIIANAIIAGQIDAGLAKEAIKWGEHYREQKK